MVLNNIYNPLFTRMTLRGKNRLPHANNELIFFQGEGKDFQRGSIGVSTGAETAVAAVSERYRGDNVFGDGPVLPGEGAARKPDVPGHACQASRGHSRGQLRWSRNQAFFPLPRNVSSAMPDLSSSPRPADTIRSY